MLLFSHLSTSFHLSSGVFKMISSLLESQFTRQVCFHIRWDFKRYFCALTFSLYVRTGWYITKPKGIVYSLDTKRLVFKKLRCWLSSRCVHCSCRGPEFLSQQPYLMVHFCLELKFQEIWHSLLTLDDTCFQIYLPFPQINNLKIKKSLEKDFY